MGFEDVGVLGTEFLGVGKLSYRVGYFQLVYAEVVLCDYRTEPEPLRRVEVDLV